MPYPPPIPPIPSTSPIPHPPNAASSVGKGPLVDILLQTTSAATNRNGEAALLFNNIASVLDDALTEIILPQYLIKKFQEFIADLTAVTHQYFECHVWGLPRPPKPYLVKAIAPGPSSTPRLVEKTQCYVPSKGRTSFANMVQTSILNKSSQTRASSRSPGPKTSETANYVKPSPKYLVDNRIFVRMSPERTCMNMSPYAVMLQLNGFLKEIIVRVVQKIKTGLAICPVPSTAQDTLLGKMSEIEAFLFTEGECKVEKPVQHSAFKLSGVPHFFSGYDTSGLELIKIFAATIGQTLLDPTNVLPINVIECQSPTDSQYSDRKNWIVAFPKGSHISKSLPLFGVRICTKLLPKRTMTSQCGNCYGWHNERACSRASRSRLCSSTKHLESGHTTCDPKRNHNCPLKSAVLYHFARP